MFALQLADGAELRPLEPWQAEEFAAARGQGTASTCGRGSRSRPGSSTSTPPANCCSATPTSRPPTPAAMYGIWVDDELNGGTLFRTFDTDHGRL